MLKRLAVASLLVALLPWRASALETEDLLALVAMPLAVAAAAELTDVPTDQLMDVVTLLNDAEVPPAQFVEVVRYAPVALVTPFEGTQFVDFVRTQEQQGATGTRLVTVIEDRYRALDLPVDLDVVAPRVVETDSGQFIPEIVRTRVAEVKTHPHGGPPGQLKKVAGVQTGAEIVHGTKPGRQRVVTATPRVVKAKPHKVHVQETQRVIVAQPSVVHGNPNRGGGNHGGGEGHGHGGGNGKGKGKGKG